ncbi:MAG: hypothetical protein IT436_16035 [Phycisphaerales bacterium]|nr:hypothetical protein [Phycisphaerales bacterium]
MRVKWRNVLVLVTAVAMATLAWTLWPRLSRSADSDRSFRWPEPGWNTGGDISDLVALGIAVLIAVVLIRAWNVSRRPGP